MYTATLPALCWGGNAWALTPKPPTDLTVDGQTGTNPPPVAGSPAIVPAESSTIWNPGIYGGVPSDNADPASFPNGVGPAIQHGSTIAAGASASTIQSALNAAGAAATKTSRRFVQLGAGTFNLEASLSIPSYVILRGTSTGIGNRQTVLRGGSNLVNFQGAGFGNNWGTITGVVGVANKGDSTITVQDASTISVGDIISIDHLSDGSSPGPASGVSTYNPPSDGDYVWWLDSVYYQRIPYSTGNGTHFLAPDTSAPRHVAQRCEVLAKDGNTLTIYDAQTRRGSPLHTSFYDNPEVYRCAGSGADIVRYAGLENVVLQPGGQGHVVELNGAAFCWVKNIESNGTAQFWSGRHLYLRPQTYRCEVRDSYFHGSGNLWPGGNAYGINVSGSENLIENNVSRELNKPIVLICSNGGNVIAYNYADEAVLGALDGTWQEAAISSHAAFCHHELFEGNWTPNIGPDSTVGNNGWNTVFRNHCRGQNSSGHTTAYRRCIFADGWQRDLVSIGNVLSFPGNSVNHLITAATQSDHEGNTSGIGYQGISQNQIYLIGSNAWMVGDGIKRGADYVDNGHTYSYFHRHLDYDYHSNSQYVNPSNPETQLPNSLYLQSKPAFFGSYAWPWVDPAGTSNEERVKTLPAKARYEAGNP